MRWLRACGPVFALLLTAAPVSGTDVAMSSWLAVRVADDRGLPLADASVRVVARHGVGERLVDTGSDGWADLFHLPPGVYRLEVDRPGYQWLEMDDLRLAPGDRLVLRLEVAPTDADEVVVLSGGPMVPAAGLSATRARERSWLDALPEPDHVDRVAVLVDGRPSDLLPPRASVAFVTAGEGAVDLTMAAHGWGAAGRVELRVGATSAGDAPASRGAVHGSLRDIEGTFSLARRWDYTSVSVVGHGSIRERESRSRAPMPGSQVAPERTVEASGRDVGMLIAVDRQLNAAHRIEGRLRSGTASEDGFAPSLFVAHGTEIPTTERANAVIAADVRSTIAGPTTVTAFRLTADRADSERRPDLAGRALVDISVDGALSGGIGHGVLASGGGLDRADGKEDSWLLAAAMTRQSNGAMRLSAAGVLERRSSERIGGGVVREWWRGPGAIDRFSLDADRAAWSEDGARFLLGLDWRPADVVTVSAVLRAAPRTIRGEHGELSFGVGETLAPSLGVAWDFEGSGRSRAWLTWSRTRSSPSQNVRRRLGGFSDGVLTVSDGPAAPTSVTVAEHPTPGVRDHWVAGVEYEVLNHVAVGGAVSMDRRWRDLATWWAPGEPDLVVGTAADVGLEDLSSGADRVDLWIRKRRSAGWQLELRLAWQDQRGNWSDPGDPLEEPTAGFLDDVITASAISMGDLADGRRWAADLNGAWTFSEGPSVGWWLAWRSGLPRTRLGAESAGLGLDRRVIGQRGAAGTTEGLWWVGVSTEWHWAVAEGELKLRLEGRNLVSSGSALTVDDRFTVSTTDDGGREFQGWGRALHMVKPPEVRAGLTFSW